MSDVVVIGAGIAGIVVAQQLQQAGYRVIVVEKSRGVGGRVATRRLYETWADHGACYVKPEGEFLPHLIEVLENRHILQVWTEQVYQMESPGNLQVGKQYPRYVAPMGMSAIAKFLATGLDIRFNQRVQSITCTNNTWHLSCDVSSEATEELIANAVVVAIPAPQALMLLETLAKTALNAEFLDTLRSVEFAPCISVMAGYPIERQQDLKTLNLAWKACTFKDSILGWIGLDSSKRPDNHHSPVFVLQSSAEFANIYLDAEDLNPPAQEMLSRAAQLLIPWLDSPDWLQIHRWRYAFPNRPLEQDFLDAKTDLPLICCGDWCRGNLIESAINSGLATATQINNQMQQKPLPGKEFLAALT